jgi:acyl carrier protein
MSDREQKLRTVLAEVSHRELLRTGLDADLVRELGLDSLAALRLLAAVEKRFAVRFPDERLAEFRTLRQLLDFIEQHEPKKEGRTLKCDGAGQEGKP